MNDAFWSKKKFKNQYLSENVKTPRVCIRKDTLPKTLDKTC